VASAEAGGTMTFAAFTAALAVIAALHVPHWHYVSSTCYAQAGITASGIHTYVGEVAMDSVPLGTHIELSRPVFGRRRFTVLDRIGSGSELDVFNPSEDECLRYGRQRIGYVVTR
jgi:3D (Asp-Asp-Asp) domain-containing protein